MDLRIDVTNGLDWTNLQRRLSDVERAVLVRYETEIVRYYRDGWTGWKYAGRPRGAPRNVSYQAWEGRVTSTQEGASLAIVNEARDYRYDRPYVSEVRRSKGQRPEWEVVTDAVEADLLTALVEDMADAIQAELQKPGRTRRIRDVDSGTESLDLEL